MHITLLYVIRVANSDVSEYSSLLGCDAVTLVPDVSKYRFALFLKGNENLKVQLLLKMPTRKDVFGTCLKLIKRSNLMQQYADVYSLHSHSTCFGCHSTHHQEY